MISVENGVVRYLMGDQQVLRQANIFLLNCCPLGGHRAVPASYRRIRADDAVHGTSESVPGPRKIQA